jgi:hypothetical protein
LPAIALILPFVHRIHGGLGSRTVTDVTNREDLDKSATI